MKSFKQHISEAKIQIIRKFESLETLKVMDGRYGKGEWYWQGKVREVYNDTAKTRYQMGYSQVAQFSQKQLQIWEKEGKIQVLERK